MQRFIFLLMAVLPIAATTGCRQQDIRTMPITLSGVSTEADQLSVSNAIAPLDGVIARSIIWNGTNTMSVRYDSMKLARKNIEYAIAEAGFGANDLPAHPKKNAPLGPRVRQ